MKVFLMSTQRQLAQRTIFFTVVCLTGLLFSLCSGETTPSSRQILILYPQSRDVPAYQAFEHGFKAQIEMSGEKNIQFSYEYLELDKYSQSETYINQLTGLLKQKYETKPPDLVITYQEPAAKLSLDYGQGIFPGKPVIWVLNDLEGLARKAPPPDVGVLSTAM